tara:strand:- start:2477 stop:3121 length:645 start_codon:yes stop_codon:yes gene_type:complete
LSALIDDFDKSLKYYKKRPPFKSPNFYYDAVSRAKVDGMWLEFGVWVGTSSRIISSFMPDKNKVLYGFDSFEGLPEDWACSETGVVQKEGKKGAFNLNGEIPKPPAKNIKYIKGWFEDTLPDFVKEHKEPLAFLHVDSDLYSSAKTIFNHLSDRIVKGTVIIFDEFYNYVGYKDHEYKAFQELLQEKDISYKWIGHVVDGRQASLIITEVKDNA